MPRIRLDRSAQGEAITNGAAIRGMSNRHQPVELIVASRGSKSHLRVKSSPSSTISPRLVRRRKWSFSLAAVLVWVASSTSSNVPSSSSASVAMSLACPSVADQSSSLDVQTLAAAGVSSESQFVLLVTDLPAADDALCVLTELRRDDAGEVDRVTAYLPIARAYGGHDLEASGGAHALALFRDETDHPDRQPVCADADGGGRECAVVLPGLSGGGTYELRSYSYGLAGRRDEVARFLERASFGATPADLDRHATSEWDIDPVAYQARHLWRQMYDAAAYPRTSHREFYRKRASPVQTNPSRTGWSGHPCDPNSSWRRPALISEDRMNVVTRVSKLLEVEFHPTLDSNLEAPLYLEAEDATTVSGYTFLSSSKAYSSSSGSTSGIFVQHQWWKDSFLEWENVVVPASGSYALSMRYGDGVSGGARETEIQVNGVHAAYLETQYTLHKTNFKYTDYVWVYLDEGNNAIRLIPSPNRREKTYTNAGVWIDRIRIGREKDAILKIDGEYRTVVEGGIHLFDDKDYSFEANPGVTYEICNQIESWVHANNDGRLRIRHNGGCKDLDALNPRIKFPSGYESYQPATLDLAADLSDASQWTVIEDQQRGGRPLPNKDFVLIPGLVGDSNCDSLPNTAYEEAAPVLGQLPSGEILQWTPRLRWSTNTLDQPLSDGGGYVRQQTSSTDPNNQVLCSNVPRSPFNEDSCVLSSSNTACTSTDTLPDIDITLDETTIPTLFDLTGRYVYALDNLPLEANNNLEPCQSREFTRWLKLSVTECPTPTVLQNDTNATFAHMLITASDVGNPYLVDAKFPTEGGYSCAAVDDDLLDIDIIIGSTCFRHVHPLHWSVFDATSWVSVHPGGAERIQMWAECYQSKNTLYDNDEVNLCDGRSWDGWKLIFPTHRSHDLARWGVGENHWTPIVDGSNGKGPGAARFGDSVAFHSLINDIKTSDVSEEYGGMVLVCGSPGEVANDPQLGALFSVENRLQSFVSRLNANQQKSDIFWSIAFKAEDQLGQRSVWNMLQILTVVPPNIDAFKETEVYAVYADILGRHIFGNYLDLLLEVSYSALQGEHLTYVGGKSHAYIYEKEGRLSAPDENWPREVMQLFSIGLFKLNEDGTPELDENGVEQATYGNEDIMSFARGWTGFLRHPSRGNIESHDGQSRVDPMHINPEYRDRFPIHDLSGGYIGAGHVLCEDLPERAFLLQGAKYRLLGSNPLPTSMNDHPNYNNPAYSNSIQRFVLSTGSALYSKLHNDGDYQGTVVLDSNLMCTGDECSVDTLRVVQVSSDPDIYYEYMQVPCIQYAFYNGGKGVARYSRSERHSNMCANPKLPHAGEACCDESTRNFFAFRNYVYDGERVKYSTAESRCGSTGLCVYGVVSGVPNQERHHTQHHWLNTGCHIQVKVRASDGYVAIVHELESGLVDEDVDMALHVSEEAQNWFKVYWEGSYPNKDGNGCGNCRTLDDDDETCLCGTSVAEAVGFATAEEITTSEDILSSLSVGSLDPSVLDPSGTMYTEEVNTEKGFTAYLKNPYTAGQYTTDTIFKVTQEGSRVHLRLNKVSTVQLEGWNASLTTAIFQAEDAIASSAATLNTGRDRYSGTGHMEFTTNQPSQLPMFLEWNVTAHASTDAMIQFRYANDDSESKNRPMQLLVNGEMVEAQLDFLFTYQEDGMWWRPHWALSDATTVHLSGGINTIRLQQDYSTYPPGEQANHTLDWIGPSSNDIARCQRGCSSDDDCAEDLYCFRRANYVPSRVPGCNGTTTREMSNYCTTREYHFSRGGPTIDYMRMEGLPSVAPPTADGPRYRFPNPLQFMGLLQDDRGDGSGETNERDARYMTEAIVQHYVNHQNTAPFLCHKLIQRYGSSNPSRKHVKACARAFITGTFTSNGVTFGDGKYGSLAATIAAILLDKELTSVVLDRDPAAGAMREPLLKVVASMRNLDFILSDREDTVKIYNSQKRLAQEAYEFSSVFSFFKPDYRPSNLITSGLVAPEAQIADMPTFVDYANGLLGISRYGLSDCYRSWEEEISYGFGYNTNVYGRCDNVGDYRGSNGWYNYRVPSTNSNVVVNELATLLTAGRLSQKNRAILEAAYDTEKDFGDHDSAQRLVLQGIQFTPEYNTYQTVAEVKEARPAAPPQALAVGGYKAIVYIFLNGGMDSWNMLPPYPGGCPAENDIYAEYAGIRRGVALNDTDMLELSGITGHHTKCTSFGLHKELSILKDWFDAGDASFIANSGLLSKLVDKSNYRSETAVQLFDHNGMTIQSNRLDLGKDAPGSGVLGRISEAIKASHAVNIYSVSGNQPATNGRPGVDISPLTLSSERMKRFNPTDYPSNPQASMEMEDLIASLNTASGTHSSLMGETWSQIALGAMGQHDQLFSALDGAEPTTEFPDNELGNKLKSIATVMKQTHNGIIRDNRQIFVADMDGFDTHSFLISSLEEKFTIINDALTAFEEELKRLGLWSSTTIVQLSEFARTLDPNGGETGDGTGQGSDHAWGGVNFIAGGPVKGGQILGEYPNDFSSKSPITLDRGRLIPTTPHDSMWNAVAKWFGVDESEMDAVLPQRSNFPPSDIYDVATLYVTS